MAKSKFKSSDVTADQRLSMIAEAAYFRAEHRGFLSGDPMTDWIEAEAEIDCLLNSSAGGIHESETKRSYQKMLEAQLEEWDKKLEEVTVAAKKAGTKLRSELDSRLAELTEQRAAAQTQLAQLREYGGETWHELRQNADRLWDDLRDSLDEIMARLRVSTKRESKDQETRI
jgi:Protein of unknown function (DUF2934)